MFTTKTTKNHRLGRHMAATACAIGVGCAALAAPVGASEPAATPASVQAEVPPRLERACLRIPNLTIRAERLIDRIQGDADTRGSLAWLDTKIAQAEAEGRTELHTVLVNRRAVREQTVPVLELRLERLADLSQRCAEAGVGQ